MLIGRTTFNVDLRAPHCPPEARRRANLAFLEMRLRCPWLRERGNWHQMLHSLASRSMEGRCMRKTFRG